MEIEDAASPVVVGVVTTTDLRTAFTDVDYAVFLGGFPRLPVRMYVMYVCSPFFSQSSPHRPCRQNLLFHRCSTSPLHNLPTYQHTPQSFFPPTQGMERKELLAKNVEIITSHAGALDEFASKDVRVVVVANPANTLALVAQKRASTIPSSHFTCLTRLDHDRLRGMVAKKLTSMQPVGSEVASTQVRNAIIWGNHSSTQVPSAAQAEVKFIDSEKWVPLHEVISDKDNTWLYEVSKSKVVCLIITPPSSSFFLSFFIIINLSIHASHPSIHPSIFSDTPPLPLHTPQDLVSSVQQRGAEVLAARKLSSALSAAQAIASHLKDWAHGTAEGEFVSMGVLSTGNPYEGVVPDDIFFSFPVTCEKGEWRIVPGLSMAAETRKRLPATVEELVEERSHAVGHSHL